jgi:hypothetical protein
MFKELLTARASNLSAPRVVEAEVYSKVTNTPPVMYNLKRLASLNYAASDMSNLSGDDDAKRGAPQEDVGRGKGLEEDVHRGLEEAQTRGREMEAGKPKRRMRRRTMICTWIWTI